MAALPSPRVATGSDSDASCYANADRDIEGSSDDAPFYSSTSSLFNTAISSSVFANLVVGTTAGLPLVDEVLVDDAVDVEGAVVVVVVAL